jgi:hypothetical protein
MTCEGKQPLRGDTPLWVIFAAGVLLLGPNVIVLICLLGHGYPGMPPTVMCGVILLLPIGFVFGGLLLWVWYQRVFRKGDCVLEMGEAGLRRPGRHREWMPCDRISEIRFRPLRFGVEVTGAQGEPVLRYGLETFGYPVALTEIAERATKLQAEKGIQSDYCVTILPQMCLLLFVAVICCLVTRCYVPIMLPGVLLIMLLGVTIAVSTPTRLTVESDRLCVSYRLKKTRIPLGQIESVFLGHRVVALHIHGRARLLKIPLGRASLDAFYAVRRAVKKVQSSGEAPIPDQGTLGSGQSRTVR